MICRHGLPLAWCPWCFVPSYPCVLALALLVVGCDHDCKNPVHRFRYLRDCSQHQPMEKCEANWKRLVQECRKP